MKVKCGTTYTLVIIFSIYLQQLCTNLTILRTCEPAASRDISLSSPGSGAVEHINELNSSNSPQWKKVKSLSPVWLCDPMDCSPPGFSVHGIFDARVLEWVAISFSRVHRVSQKQAWLKGLWAHTKWLRRASQVMLVVKKPPVSVGDPGDLGLIPGSGRSSGEGNGYALQYSCLENSMNRGVWWAIVHGVSKESNTTKQLTLHSISHQAWGLPDPWLPALSPLLSWQPFTSSSPLLLAEASTASVTCEYAGVTFPACLLSFIATHRAEQPSPHLFHWSEFYHLVKWAGNDTSKVIAIQSEPPTVRCSGGGTRLVLQGSQWYRVQRLNFFTSREGFFFC